MEQNESYRASVAALIINQQKEFLLLELTCARHGELDFAKGGMKKGETAIQTLNRELAEELGENFKYEIIERSDWGIVYDWSEDLQKRKGFMGQARVNYWVIYRDGEINLRPEEIRAYKWIPADKLIKTMRESGFPELHCMNMQFIWDNFQKDHSDLFD